MYSLELCPYCAGGNDMTRMDSGCCLFWSKDDITVETTHGIGSIPGSHDGGWVQEGL